MLVCRDCPVPVFQVLVGEGEIAPCTPIVRFVCGYLFEDLRRSVIVVCLETCDARSECWFARRGLGLGLRRTSDSNDKEYSKTRFPCDDRGFHRHSSYLLADHARTRYRNIALCRPPGSADLLARTLDGV